MINPPSGDPTASAAHPPAALNRHDDGAARAPLLRQPEDAIAIEQPARINPQPRRAAAGPAPKIRSPRKSARLGTGPAAASPAQTPARRQRRDHHVYASTPRDPATTLPHHGGAVNRLTVAPAAPQAYVCRMSDPRRARRRAAARGVAHARHAARERHLRDLCAGAHGAARERSFRRARCHRPDGSVDRIELWGRRIGRGLEPCRLGRARDLSLSHVFRQVSDERSNDPLGWRGASAPSLAAIRGDGDRGVPPPAGKIPRAVRRSGDQDRRLSDRRGARSSGREVPSSICSACSRASACRSARKARRRRCRT